jgi:hypothetical protein
MARSIVLFALAYAFVGSVCSASSPESYTFGGWNAACRPLSADDLRNPASTSINGVCVDGKLYVDSEFVLILLATDASGNWDIAIPWPADVAPSEQIKLRLKRGATVHVAGDLKFDEMCWGFTKLEDGSSRFECNPIRRPIRLARGRITIE